MNETWTFPKELLYDGNRHWIQVQNGRARIGLTEYALELTGDVLYLSLPAVGTLLERGKSMGSLEAGKWIGRLEAPLSGTVSHVNETALQQPALINSEPYQHWLLEVVWTNEAEQQHLLSALEAAKQAEEWEENAQS
ncbi:glycine cleavage system protein H [Anaeroarcus burkinensis]|uniref:glycine cleavage system protein H n=1 Tax=Anaeroarcus burkinensis TaxID=82376 RepID=UPI0003FD4069|nr:glycine cleavage system protein H [Anaeroarcus burkinensis]